MALLKLKPTFKDYLWGGHRLADDYQKEYDGDILAESWELSCHPDGPCYITNGVHSGKTLRQFIESEGKAVLGTNCERFEDFPILAKFIDARDSLSIQVHPDDAYALKYEGQYGKTEMWYVMDCEPGAYLYYGFNREVSEEEFAERIQNETLEEVLNKVDVHKGDVLFIEARTLHAICKGILIAEIQQNSNLTYRIYDYGRVGADGKKRELHVDKALKVTDRFPVVKNFGAYPHVADCEYFTVDKLYLDGSVLGSVKGTVDTSSFVSILFMEGEGQISCDGEVLPFRKGDSFLLTANSGDYEVHGKCEALVTRIREQR